jgi:8-oxo-dGTP pyrophosphatase MutT (NUDIX family)
MNSEVELPLSWTREGLRKRLAVPRQAPARGDAATARRLAQNADFKAFEEVLVPPPVPAAVLVPLVEHTTGFTVLFTQRTAELKSHAGQISFPGGRMEPGDQDAFAGALRETAEEIGIGASHIEIMGTLDAYVTITGYAITPVVGVVRPPFDLKTDPVEVADVFEVPLAFFLDPANHQRHSRTLPDGVVRGYYAIPYGDRYIWGATAGMLINLYEVLAATL